MLDDQRRAAKVIHVRPARRVVHRVGQVADEQHVLAVARHVAQAERAAEHAHIRMHPDEHYVADAARLEQVPNLNAAVADRVALGVDLDHVHLPLPRAARVAAQLGQSIGPGGVLRRVVVLAAVGVVDRVALAFLHRIDPVAPALDGLRLHGSRRSGLGAFARGVVLVKRHAGRRRVDDQRALCPGGADKPVHAGCHFTDSADGVFAMVQIPHVADDHRCGLGLPKHRLLSHCPVPGGIPCAAARVEGERPGGGRGERKEEGNCGGTFHGGVARDALGLAKRCQLKQAARQTRLRKGGPRV